MISKVSAGLKKIVWSDSDVAQFLGAYLSEPKADVVFNTNKKMALPIFAKKVAKSGIVLDLKSQMLFSDNTFFINGESVTIAGAGAETLKELADKRAIPAIVIEDAPLLQLLYDWYIAVYLSFNVASDNVASKIF